MKKILITGALGQIGVQLVKYLQERYGKENVIPTDVRKVIPEIATGYHYVDVVEYSQVAKVIAECDVDTVIHNAAILSADAEKNPDLAIKVNSRGSENILKAGKDFGLKVMIPSTIGAFSRETQKEKAPNLAVMRPDKLYGVTKIYAELLGKFYHSRYNTDFRSIRLPGILSSDLLGGGTTDYAVEMLKSAANGDEVYVCPIAEETKLPMMHIVDALRGIEQIMCVESKILGNTRTYNVSAISFTPRELHEEICKYIPNFEVIYKPDFRQEIADTWPEAMDDEEARKIWGWHHTFDKEGIVKSLLKEIKEKTEGEKSYAN